MPHLILITISAIIIFGVAMISWKQRQLNFGYFAVFALWIITTVSTIWLLMPEKPKENTIITSTQTSPKMSDQTTITSNLKNKQ